MDALYGTVVIEYKAPGLLREDNSYRDNKKAIKQTKRYLKKLSKNYNWPASMMTGVIIDGFKLINVPMGRVAANPVPVKPRTLEQFLRRFKLLSQEEPFSADRIKEYFGGGSQLTREVVNALYQTFINRSSSHTDTFYDQWKYMFSISHGSTKERYLKKLQETTGIEPENKDAAMGLLFCLYTYVVLVVKVIAADLVSYYSGLELQSTSLVGKTGEELKEAFKKLERSEIFEEKGVKNFTEGNFFSWYLYEWSGVKHSLIKLIEQVGSLNPRSLTENPEDTEDLLKGLYQDLVPKELRKQLGEFYTPDWLAEYLYEQIDFSGDPKKRLLDPGCGSGTFLVKGIKEVKKHLKERELIQDKEDKIHYGKKILNNIVGFDLNPVAVVAARTNYILALGDMFTALLNSDESINMPVYLCDSILTPRVQQQLSLTSGQENKEMVESESYSYSEPNKYEIRTARGSFSLPRETIEANEVEPLTDIIEETIQKERGGDKFWEEAQEKLTTANSGTKSTIIGLYKDISELAEQQEDDIWPRIIKNGFAQSMQDPFDFVIGNPPWVNWDNLPSEWRESSKALWKKYGLFSLSGYEQQLGKAKPDISMLFTYLCVDNYLSSGGTLSFLIKQTLFQSKGSGEGFRRFQLGEKEFLKVEEADDLVEIKPFEGVSNRTAAVRIRKGKETKYPVPYTIWEKKRRGKVPQEESLESVIENWVERRRVLAKPIKGEDKTSPWILGDRKALDALQKVIGESGYKAREGANTEGLNGGYWISVLGKDDNENLNVENLYNAGRKNVPKINTKIEPDLIYPLLRSGELERWFPEPHNHIIIPQNMNEGAGGFPVEKLKEKWEKTYDYFEKIKSQLNARPSYHHHFDPETDPFYSVYGVGPYTLSKYKVAWRRMGGTFISAVLEPQSIPFLSNNHKPLVPQETIAFIPVDKREKAYFLSGLLNSSIAQLLVLSYGVKGSKSLSSTDLPDVLKLPEFDAQNPIHKKLVELSQKAHREKQEKQPNKLQETEKQIDKESIKVWDIKEKGLEDIHSSLEKML